MLHKNDSLKLFQVTVKAKNILNVSQLYDEKKNVIDYVWTFIPEIKTE